jgi:ubiquinone/menaquinone biosynthesis C-methylase UbiE
MSEPAATGRDSWGEDDNARRYEAFARRHLIYQLTSKDLVGLARLADDASVLDLACGTGATTREVLAVLGPAGRVIAADKSAAMLAVAAESVSDPRATWVRSAAESIDERLTQPVDAVVCNSAIWQTDLPATAAAVRNVIAPGGRFVFNIGCGFLEHHDDPNYEGDLREVMRAIAASDYDWTPPAQPAPAGRPRLTRESVVRCLEEAGFAVEPVVIFAYEESGEAERAWLTVPVFTQRHLPGLPYQQRMAVLAKAFDQHRADRSTSSRWATFAAVKPSG